MERYYLKIAGFVIEVILEETEWKFAFDYFKKNILSYYRGFFINKDEKINFLIKIKEINFLKVKKDKDFSFSFFEKKRNSIITNYQISLFQFQIILRNILLELLRKNQGFMIHCSAVKISKKYCYLFLGKNGSGKSTIVKKISLKRKTKILADDIGIIRKIKDEFYFYQAPMIEKNYVKKDNHFYLIKKIFFLKKTKDKEKKYLIKNKVYFFKDFFSQVWLDSYNKKQIKICNLFFKKNNFFIFLNKWIILE